MRRRYRFLCLHHFEVVGDSGGKAILRLRERLIGKIHRALGDFHLIGG